MGIIKKFRITEFKEDRPKILLKDISLSFKLVEGLAKELGISY